MYCKKCGSLMNDNAKYCLACGAKVEEDVFDTQTGQIINAYNDDAYTKPENSTTILVCGAMSIIFCILNYVGIPFVHLVGITFGIIGARLANKDKIKFKNYSKTGLALNVIGIFLGVLAFVIGFMYGSGLIS